MQLSENFSLAEYSKSNTAVRLDIDNEPLDEHLESAINLFENVKRVTLSVMAPIIKKLSNGLSIT